jgi:hypothetical protein
VSDWGYWRGPGAGGGGVRKGMEVRNGDIKVIAVDLTYDAVMTVPVISRSQLVSFWCYSERVLNRSCVMAASNPQLLSNPRYLNPLSIRNLRVSAIVDIVTALRKKR